MKKVEKIESLSDLLSKPGVVEEMELRSSFGVCALHGGGLERATEAVARDVAKETNSSYYALIQPEGSRLHLSSKRKRRRFLGCASWRNQQRTCLPSSRFIKRSFTRGVSCS